jgi:membrane-associated protease RseP (regulator of RpoE activity)
LIPKTKGLVVEGVVQGSSAAQRNLRRGDVIMSADGQPILKPEDLAAQVAAVKKKGLEAILVEVRRRGIRSGLRAAAFREADCLEQTVVILQQPVAVMRQALHFLACAAQHSTARLSLDR